MLIVYECENCHNRWTGSPEFSLKKNWEISNKVCRCPKILYPRPTKLAKIVASLDNIPNIVEKVIDDFEHQWHNNEVVIISRGEMNED